MSGPRRSVRTLALRLALVVLAPAGAWGGPQEQAPRLAPDGKPGLGASTSLSDLLELARSSRGEGAELLSGLRALGSEVRLLLAGVSESYRAQGYFDLLDPRAEPGLESLLAAWRALLVDPYQALAAGGPKARAFARMTLDPRFAVRAGLADDFVLEARELEAGLALFEGAVTSFVLLDEEEARGIAQRVDLSASRLRALRSDLLALRSETAGARAGVKDGPEVEALLAAARTGDSATGRAAVAELLETAGERADSMRRALFSTRLSARVQRLLDWRARNLEEARQQREEALTYLPESEQGRAAPPQIQAMRKHDRLRLAGMHAREGLVADPLDAELAFLAAHAADFQWGSLESRPLYDRFLFLVGIRHYDHRTLAGRKLDARAEEALLAVQRPDAREPRRPSERKGGL